jgi:diguanylate cyclase (GGDEF)-like protein
LGERSTPRMRDPGPPTPKLVARRFFLASSSLALFMLLVLLILMQIEWHGHLEHEDPEPLLGAVRLVLALPFLLLFGVVVGSAEGMPRVATLTLSSTTALLTLWMVVEAASSIHGETPRDENVEVIVNFLMVGAILATLYYGSRAAQQSVARELEARRRDPLTGLLNRQEVQASFEQATSPVTLLMLDLNGLGRVNDLSGHAAGDARLQEVAEALREALPPQAEVGRWGGDEFVAVISECSVTEALELVTRLNDALPPVQPGLPALAFGAVSVPAHSPFERALALADAAMHECKERQQEETNRTASGPAVRTIEEFTANLEQFDDPEVVAKDGLELARQLLGFELAVYYLRRGDRLELASYSGPVPQEVKPVLESTFQSLPVRGIRGLASEAVQLRHTVWQSDYTSFQGTVPSFRDFGLKSVIVAPIVVAEGVEGIFGLNAVSHLASDHPVGALGYRGAGDENGARA